MNNSQLLRVFVYTIFLTVAACGGGGGGGGGGDSLAGTPTSPDTDPGPGDPGVDQSDGGIGGTGGVNGAVQDFGSVFVNDIEMETDSATIRIEGQEANEDALRAGQQVLVIGDLPSRVAETVEYRANVKGVVDSVVILDPDLGEASLTVLGQTIRTTAATRYVNGSLPTLGAGGFLEVSGYVDVNGVIFATYIETLSSLETFKVIGVVSGSTAQGFSINQLAVDISQSTLENFGDIELSDGLLVEIRAPADAFSASAVTAQRVELLQRAQFLEGAGLDIEGFITRFASSADFSLQQIDVMTDSTTEFLNGNAASLALNIKVQVEGTLDASNRLQAGRVIIQSLEAVRAEGLVEAMNSAASTVTVLGVAFTVRPQTELEDKSDTDIEPFMFADINVGDYLEVRGYVDASAVVASSIEREDIDERSRLRGPVTAENAAAGELDILNVSVKGVVGITDYNDAKDNQITQGQFHDALELGDVVKATWRNFDSTGDVADEIEFETSD